MRASSLLCAVAALALASAASAQQGPPMQRVTGTVSSVSSSELVIATASGPVHVGLTPQTAVMKQEAAKADDIAAGSYLGTANQTNADGASGTSTEVHIMANGPNVNAPMNNAGLVMTNGHVASVKTTQAGREMDIDYGQGTTRHVVVPAGTPTTRMSVANAAALAAGQTVTAATQVGADQKPVAAFVMISAAK
jgi:hypothetical protein